MAIHIPWDKYETALLIDACHNYNLGNMSRREAIVSVSQTLRRRAVNKGKIGRASCRERVCQYV